MLILCSSLTRFESIQSLSSWELKRLRNLVIDVKEKGIKVASALVKQMLERNVFLFGFVDIHDGSVTERVNELTDIQNARVQVAHKKISHVLCAIARYSAPAKDLETTAFFLLFHDTMVTIESIEARSRTLISPRSCIVSISEIGEPRLITSYEEQSQVRRSFQVPQNVIYRVKGMELDVDVLKKMSTDYAVAKELAIKEASEVVDVQNIKHIAENKKLIGEMVEKTAQDWNTQKESFYQQTGLNHAAGPHATHSVPANPVIIGGMVLDIHATHSVPANPRTTTPGKLSICGGESTR
ncbi:hypothetical protein LOK49_LG05G01926 [Camellia lanceoleosa]|uniref:Uncharacterized protein n=1 Tax=Camellia lanceoleosa TaxID=1840588 RepID=A0ACC0HUU8_9ERIC|nr:hypothetical protein LOK49_LG05G01926 [Camellia lanceoleosa]